MVPRLLFGSMAVLLLLASEATAMGRCPPRPAISAKAGLLGTPDAAVDSGAPGGPRPDADGPSVCEQADQTFRDFVAVNRTCNVTADCAVIGDCGPNADFEAINAAAAAMGYALMGQRCPAAFDGFTFAALCQDGQCVLGPENGCCGCVSDAGVIAD
jgi:hypothetical protein